MLLSSKILRGLEVKGSIMYSPSFPEENNMDSPSFTETEHPAEEDPRKKVEDFLEKAREEFEKERLQMMREAEEEARLLKEKARGEGFAEGLEKGEIKAARLQKQAEEVLKQAKKERREILAGAEPEIIQIALEIAEKLLNYKVETDSNCILQLIYRTMETLPAGQNVTLRVSPPDEKICQENFQRLQGRLKNDVHLEIQPDEEMPLGSCTVESEESQVELLLQKELEILSNKLLELASSAREDAMQEEEHDL